MPYIKLVNEEGTDCISEEHLKNLICYCFSPHKTMQDSARVNPSFQGIYTGCEPFLFPREYEHDAEVVLQFFRYINRVFPNDRQTLAMHRIISFHASELILPQDIDVLARRIACFYAEKGYVAAYAVHADTAEVHAHFVVCASSYRDGNSFHIAFEYNHLEHIIRSWESEHDERLDSDLSFRNHREQALFGNLSYGRAAISAEGQIKNCRKDYKQYGHI